MSLHIIWQSGKRKSPKSGVYYANLGNRHQWWWWLEWLLSHIKNCVRQAAQSSTGQKDSSFRNMFTTWKEQPHNTHCWLALPSWVGGLPCLCGRIHQTELNQDSSSWSIYPLIKNMCSYTFLKLLVMQQKVNVNVWSFPSLMNKTKNSQRVCRMYCLKK